MTKLVVKILKLCKVFLKDIHLVISFYVCSIFKIKKNKVVFSSFSGSLYGREPYEVSNKLLKETNNVDIVWIYDGQIDNKKIRVVKPNSGRAMYELRTANVWIDNCRKKFWIKKRKKQLYIQTWHGAVCIKAVEKDAEKTLPYWYIKSSMMDSNNADYIVAECKWREENIYNSFWYNGPIIRARFQYDLTNAAMRVRHTYGIKEEEKIILYVPTFRRDENLNCYISDFRSVVEYLEKYTGEKYKVIVRLHSVVAKRQEFFKQDMCIVNGTEYDSVDELIMSAEYVISDYSGCIFDAFRMGKKVVLFAKDLETYVEEDRELYFDLKTFPSPIVDNESDLADKMAELNSNIEYENKRKKFVEKLGYYKDDAGEIIAKQIRSYLNS